MSGQLWKIMHKQSSDASFPNSPPIMMKNQVDVVAMQKITWETPVRYIMVALQTDVIPVLMVCEEK